MFSSPCSLRSSTCATLIALATAAGISRFEPPPAHTAASLPAIIRVLAAVAKPPQVPSYPLSIAACAQAGPTAPRTLSAWAGETLAPPAATASAAGWSPTPCAIETEISFFDWAGAVPTAREHSYPYAVGPPRRGTDTPLRAAGHAWPGDSSARRSQVSRIAHVYVLTVVAPLTRPSSFLPRSASRFSPASAEASQPGFSLRAVQLAVRLVARARSGAAFLSP